MKHLQADAIKISGYKITQPNSDNLIIQKSWKESLFPFLLILLFFIIWYYGLLSAKGHEEPNMFTRAVNIIKEEPPMIIFFLVPIFIILPLLFKLANKVFNKETLSIDGKRGVIMKNNRLLTSFADIKTLSMNNSELNILLDDERKIQLVKSRHSAALRKVANILSEFTKLPIT